MKTEVMKYQALAGSIKSFEERKDRKGKDTFDLSDWWKSNCATLPGFAYVLRSVLTNSSNSCPPESLFSIFNSTYNDDQKRSHTDYIELSMQSTCMKLPFVCMRDQGSNPTMSVKEEQSDKVIIQTVRSVHHQTHKDNWVWTISIHPAVVEYVTMFYQCFKPLKHVLILL
jgi:hypothetical protein